MKILYTIGYGNLAPANFALKLLDIDEILDVRRHNCRSWCASYSAKNIKDYLKQLDIRYVSFHELANRFANLKEYTKWLNILNSWIMFGNPVQRIRQRTKIGFTSCLLCAEGDPFDKDGKARCHRVPLADAIVNLLNEFPGETWEVCHL